MTHIYIIHYHLNTGGVARIIKMQAEALRRLYPNMPISILVGSCPNPEDFQQNNLELIINPELNYLTANQVKAQILDEKYKQLKSFFEQTLQVGGIVNVHNLNLGKNPVLTLVLSEWAQAGYSLVNQAHDFSEDRPANQALLQEVICGHFKQDLQTVMYPGINNYLFGVLSHTDAKRLVDYGVRQEQVSIIANPVQATVERTPSDKKTARQHLINTLGLKTDRAILTYPVRVIRRKNIGEFVLLATLLTEQANWLVTLPPKNPIEKEAYNQWTAFCEKESLAVEFEVSLRAGFENVMQATDICLTTSIQEGFGMVFLEPWLMNIPVVGRDIPTVTVDFKQQGVQFPMLYDKLTVEHEHQTLDFKDLKLAEQQAVILKAKQQADYRRELINRNAFLLQLFEPIEDCIIQQNRQLIETHYSLENYAQHLDASYQRAFAGT